MKLSVSRLDDEIRDIENRLALERLELEDAIAGCTGSLRQTAASPKTLIALAGVGFVLGKILFGRKAPPPVATTPQKTGFLGLLTGLAGTAVSLMQPGLAGSIVRWAAARAFADKPAPAAERPRSPFTETAPAQPPLRPVPRPRTESVSRAG